MRNQLNKDYSIMSNSNAQQDFLWIAIGDIHDDTSRLAEIPELEHADGVIITGDMTNFGGVKEAQIVLLSIQKHNERIYAQIGNMDFMEINDWLMEKDWNLHAEVHELAPNVSIFGVGASTTTPFNTPSEFPESRYAEWLEQCWAKAKKWDKTVLISHNPPNNTLCDVIGSGVHVGSTAVREFIDAHQPDICICGHIHESRNTDRIGNTIVINPGDFSAGGYVVLRYSGGELTAELKILA